MTLKELDDIEQQMSPIAHYSFNSRSITQNGIFAYAAEREDDTTDYYELLGIDGKTNKSEASRVIRMYNLYKNKMK